MYGFCLCFLFRFDSVGMDCMYLYVRDGVMENEKREDDYWGLVNI